jgi:hypothetical protein
MQTRQKMPVQSPMPHRPRWRRALWWPGTRAGWWSVRLAGAFVVCFGMALALVAAGQRGGDTFFSNPSLALTMLTAGAAAIAGGVMASVAIMSKRERSLLVVAALLLGLLALTFALGELIVPH